MATDTSSEQFFEAKYAVSADPWNFATSPYERNRYATILQFLSGRRYQRAFEPGCSIGALTFELAAVCEAVEALEISPTAAARAKERCAALLNVTVRSGSLPDSIPAGFFDLVLFSEIGYYFEAAALVQIVKRLVTQLSPGGIFLAAHWLGTSPDHRLSGDVVHELIATIPGVIRTVAERHEGFRIELFKRTER